MKGPIPSIPIAIRWTDGVIVSLVLALFLLAGSCPGQVPTSSAPASDDTVALVKRLASGQELSREDLKKLDNGLIGVETRAVSTPGVGDIEIPPVEDGEQKRIYILKMESRTGPTKELLELQKNLLRNQLMVLRVLGVMGKHQEVMARRLSRTENLNRELLTGVKDTNRGVDMARTGIASTLGETTDLSEMTEELTVAVKEMQKQLGDIETGMSDVQDTTDEVLGAVQAIESGL